jgi:hypothetical protein
VPLLDDLKGQRASARTAADEILTRAAVEQRDPTPEELAQYQAQVTAEREAADQLEAERDRQLAEVRAAVARRTGPATPREPVLTRDQSVTTGARPGACSTSPSGSCRSTSTSADWPPRNGTAPTTSGRSPRRPSALVAPWCPRRCPAG